jgi:hypothetical protein
MTILLQWLVEHAWIFYAACAVGVIIYLLRALAAQRERRLSLFTLERETATARIMRSWAMVLVFVAIGAAVFVSTAFVLPTLPIYSGGTPPLTPTLAAGVEPSTPAITPTPSSAPGSLESTFTPTATIETAAALPPPEPTEVPTPVPTDTPEAGVSGEVRVRFGDFAELVGYGLPALEVTTAQPLPLTLYWRGLEGTSATNYLVFTHLLSQDGRLIGQHDGAPAGGTRPTTGWVAGEIITDPHSMAFADAAYTGPAKIAVGLYDPATGRVLTDTGDDRVVLPVTLNVIAQ